MNSISKPPTELTELNCGSMMELVLQVWLLILILEVAAVTLGLIVFNNELYFRATDGINGLIGSMMELVLQVWLLISDSKS